MDHTTIMQQKWNINFLLTATVYALLYSTIYMILYPFLIHTRANAVFIPIVAAASINFSPAQVRLLHVFEGGSYYFGWDGHTRNGYEVDESSTGRWETYFASAIDTVWAFRHPLPKLARSLACSTRSVKFADYCRQNLIFSILSTVCDNRSATAQRTSVHALFTTSAWWYDGSLCCSETSGGRFSTCGEQTKHR